MLDNVNIADTPAALTNVVCWWPSRSFLLEAQMNRIACTTVVAAAALAALAAPAHSASIDFNGGATDLSNNFTQITNGTGGTVSWASTIGIGGGGGLDTTSGDGTSAIYTPSSFDFSSAGTQLEVSMFFKWQNRTAGDKPLMLGFVSASNGDLRLASNYVGARVTSNRTPNATTTGPEPRSNANTVSIDVINYANLGINNTTNASGTAALTGGMTSLAAGNWYRLSVLVENAGSNNVDYTVELADFGTAGTTLVGSLLSHTTTFANAPMTGDSSVYAAFRSAADAGADALDNFSADVVPEPASLGLLGLAPLALRRRRLH
jgi:hypothetical protein